MNGKNSKPRPYSTAKHDEGYERIYGKKIEHERLKKVIKTTFKVRKVSK